MYWVTDYSFTLPADWARKGMCVQRCISLSSQHHACSHRSHSKTVMLTFCSDPAHFSDRTTTSAWAEHYLKCGTTTFWARARARAMATAKTESKGKTYSWKTSTNDLTQTFVKQIKIHPKKSTAIVWINSLTALVYLNLMEAQMYNKGEEKDTTNIATVLNSLMQNTPGSTPWI